MCPNFGIPNATSIFLTELTNSTNPLGLKEAAWSDPYIDLSKVICLSKEVAQKKWQQEI